MATIELIPEGGPTTEEEIDGALPTIMNLHSCHVKAEEQIFLVTADSKFAFTIPYDGIIRLSLAIPKGMKK